MTGTKFIPHRHTTTTTTTSASTGGRECQRRCVSFLSI